MFPKMNSISQELREISQQLGLTWVLDGRLWWQWYQSAVVRKYYLIHYRFPDFALFYIQHPVWSHCCQMQDINKRWTCVSYSNFVSASHNGKWCPIFCQNSVAFRYLSHLILEIDLLSLAWLRWISCYLNEAHWRIYASDNLAIIIITMITTIIKKHDDNYIDDKNNDNDNDVMVIMMMIMTMIVLVLVMVIW